jgi:predicted HicB family RNase H-like nuclease
MNLRRRSKARTGGWKPLRIEPELHRRAAVLAQAEGVSLNQWIASRIETAA